MPWQEVSTMSLRHEFAVLSVQPAVNLAQLCRRFGISRKTGYKWRRRFEQAGEAGLAEHSRRPLRSPQRSAVSTREAAVQLRRTHGWGGRKIQHRLIALGHSPIPAASTISTLLKREGLIDPSDSTAHRAFTRFERAQPNELWQMDFKGHFPAGAQRCHPLTVLDDHSRYSVVLRACENEQGLATVKPALSEAFGRYGLPQQMLMDNGPPWGSDTEHALTPLTVWLIRLGIRVSHGRPYHPQTQGKEERFHRTLNAELLQQHCFKDLPHCQRHFDTWRDIYNLQRPHEALGMQVPAHCYRPSSRTFPQTLPPIEYGPDDQVRKVQSKGELSFRGRVFRIGKALRGYPIALRATLEPTQFEVFFCQQRITTIDLNQSQF